MLKIITNSPQETIAAAEKLGSLLKKGDMIAYKGGLGAGKTTFTRGLAVGLGLGDNVTSPTFALVNEYRGNDLTLYHFDMYRIESEDDLYSMGYDDYLDRGICLCEWCENIPESLPDRRVEVVIEKCPGENAVGDRIITVCIKEDPIC